MVKFNTFRYDKRAQIQLESVAELVDAPDLKSIVNIYTLANSTLQRLVKSQSITLFITCPH